MQLMDYTPKGWNPQQFDTFNALVGAALSYMVYDNALTKLGVNDPVLVQMRTDVGNLVKTLGQQLKATVTP